MRTDIFIHETPAAREWLTAAVLALSPADRDIFDALPPIRDSYWCSERRRQIWPREEWKAEHMSAVVALLAPVAAPLTADLLARRSSLEPVGFGSGAAVPMYGLTGAVARAQVASGRAAPVMAVDACGNDVLWALPGGRRVVCDGVHGVLRDVPPDADGDAYDCRAAARLADSVPA